jgi:hypothetical protein
VPLRLQSLPGAASARSYEREQPRKRIGRYDAARVRVVDALGGEMCERAVWMRRDIADHVAGVQAVDAHQQHVMHRRVGGQRWTGRRRGRRHGGRRQGGQGERRAQSRENRFHS